MPVLNSNLVHADFSSLCGSSASLPGRSSHANTNAVMITGDSQNSSPVSLRGGNTRENSRNDHQVLTSSGIVDTNSVATAGARGYEVPATNTLGAMVFENGVSDNADFDVITQHRDNPPQRVNKFHRSYMSLQFPLLFIYGQTGYHTELTLKSANGVDKGKRVTMLAYYRYQLHLRLQQYDLFFRGGRLFQQYVVGAFCAVEQNWMDFIRKKQNDIRSDYLSGLYDAISRGERDGYEVGGRIILSIGLPHRHTLLWVDSVSRIRIAEDVDQFVSAELPDPEGYNVVSKVMMHGPCGAASFKAPCMKDDKCSKTFSKKFNQNTFFDENGHVHYRRRDTGVSVTRNEFQLDNSYVVPYNRDLLLAFRAHINVEYCGWSKLIKYLFKYISKGTDRVFARVSRSIGESSTSATPS
nr:DNA helicase [Tanacetum cinerariifolium]